MAHGVSRGPGSVRLISVSGPRGHEFETAFSWRASGRLEVKGWAVLVDEVEGIPHSVVEVPVMSGSRNGGSFTGRLNPYP
jgi:hypothetical protein